MKARISWLGFVTIFVCCFWGCSPNQPNESPPIEPQAERISEPFQDASPSRTNEPIPNEQTTPEPPHDHSEITTEPLPELPPESHDASPPETLPEKTPEPPDSPRIPEQTCAKGPYQVAFGSDTVTVQCTETNGLRRYTLQTTHTLRDNEPPNKQITFQESDQHPRLRSGNILFDALFAMANEESRQNSKTFVQDGAFHQGKPVACHCFQTGQKWTWAWTRDTAYSVDLGLAWWDPKRSQNTLDFKLSQRKSGGEPQIVQDTGTGGSWPVSSDRVIWVLGAQKLSHFLSPTERKAWWKRIYPALKNTIEMDRKQLYHSKDGLMRGEQSFLDWREQSYPSWIPNHLEDIATSKSLSTNIAHWIAINFTAQVAQQLGKTNDSLLFSKQAKQLKTAIQTLYLSNAKLYSLMKTSDWDPSPVYRYDLLGNALAILHGFANEQRTQDIVQAYPHTTAGPPVMWPQQPFTPIYHNRGIWPFVTAYWLRANHRAQNAPAWIHNLKSMVRGAALNLSHMENFEFLTGANWKQTGKESGPVVNSRRQLWSVAGYLSTVVDGIFGLHSNLKGIAFRPWIPASLRKTWLLSSTLRLLGFRYQGKTIDIAIKFPKTFTDNQHFLPQAQRWNGTKLRTDELTPSQLQSKNTLTITLRAQTPASRSSLKLVKDTGRFQDFWSPKEPNISSLREVGGKLQLTLENQGEQGVLHHIYRDGKRIAENVPSGTWNDPNSTDFAHRSYCYTADSAYGKTIHRSHHSRPTCWLGTHLERQLQISPWHLETQGGQWSSNPTPRITKWGSPQDTATVRSFRVSWSGETILTARYRNPHGPLSTGISCAIKQIQIFQQGVSSPVFVGYLSFPQTAQANIATSTPVRIMLQANTNYRLQLNNTDSPHNMTSLAHFSSYSGGPGGGNASFNQVDLAGFQLLALTGKATQPTTGQQIPFNGNNDFNKYPRQQTTQPGAKLAHWERFAMSWDADWLSITIVSKVFERDLHAFFLYIQSSTTSLPSATPSRGVTYLQQTAYLPFTPNYFIGLRAKTDNHDGVGPWNGLWRKEGTRWIHQLRAHPNTTSFLAQDRHTLSFRIARHQLGSPTRLRFAAHIVNALPGNEWKFVLPTNHTPWKTATTGYYETSLNTLQAVSQWTKK